MKKKPNGEDASSIPKNQLSLQYNQTFDETVKESGRDMQSLSKSDFNDMKAYKT